MSYVDDVLNLLLGEDVPGWVARVDHSNASDFHTPGAGSGKGFAQVVHLTTPAVQRQTTRSRYEDDRTSR